MARIWPWYSLRGLHICITWFSLYGIRITWFSLYGNAADIFNINAIVLNVVLL